MEMYWEDCISNLLCIFYRTHIITSDVTKSDVMRGIRDKEFPSPHQKQNRSTEGCSKLEPSQPCFQSGELVMNMRIIHATSPKQI